MPEHKQQQSIESQVLDALRRDAALTFGALLEKNPRIARYCYGRFPVLSLAYLYKAHKIASGFEPRLTEGGEYQNQPEPDDAYIVFKECAGVNLRKYHAGSIVSPAEMLAILGKTGYLKQKSDTLLAEKETQNGIVGIYGRRGQAAQVIEGQLKVSRKPLSFRQKLSVIVAAVLAVCIAGTCVIVPVAMSGKPPPSPPGTTACTECGEEPCVCPSVCADCGENPCVCPPVCADCGENPCVCPPVCADCGEEPCVCPPVCADCGEEPCVCPPVCADCGEEPCVCPSVCAECGENPCVCPPVCADCGEEPCVCPPSPEEPTFISSAGELSAPVKNGWYVLSADLTLPADVTLGDFSGIFDGRGHTLEAEGFGPLFHTLTGELKNLNYVATGGQEAFTEPVSGESPHAGSSASIAAAGLPTFSVDDDFAFICIENRGLISDISVTVSSRIEASLNPESDKIGVFISAVAAINSGTIKNCTVLCDLEVKNTGTKECMIGTFAGENTGTVSDCVTQPLSRIAGDTADTGGIVFDNLAGGKVQNCINNASLSQVTPSADWNPHIGGIVLYNVGRIEECRNMGDILIEATYAGNQQRFIRVGGIATMNVGYIAKSKSVGQIGVSAGTHEIQAGGIAGISNAVIEACGFEGGFDVQKSAQNGIVAVGGIVGWYVSGILRNNFALFSAEVNRAETAYVGGILGVTELMSLPLFENWYYSSAPVVEFGIASAYTNGFFDAYKGFRGFIRGADVQDSNAVMRAASEEELKALAVYF